MDLGVNRDLIKEAVCAKLERHQSLPVVLQTLENGDKNDKLFQEIEKIAEIEIDHIQKEVAKDIDPIEDPENYKKLLKENSNIFKQNFKKIAKLMGNNFLY